MKLLAGAVVVAAASGFAAAWAWQGARWEAADGRRAVADAEAQRLQRRSLDSAAERHEAERASIAAQRRIQNVEVERVVQNTVYRNVCLDADGLRLIAEAAAGRDSGQPAPAVPAASAAR